MDKTKQWRPDDWVKTRYKYSHDENYCHTGGENENGKTPETEHWHWQDGFEAGADAILQAQLKEIVGRVQFGKLTPNTYNWGKKSGYIVFIPDEVGR